MRTLSHEGWCPQWFVGWQQGQKQKIKHPLLTTYSLTYSARTGSGHLHFPEIWLLQHLIGLNPDASMHTPTSPKPGLKPDVTLTCYFHSATLQGKGTQLEPGGLPELRIYSQKSEQGNQRYQRRVQEWRKCQRSAERSPQEFSRVLVRVCMWGSYPKPGKDSTSSIRGDSSRSSPRAMNSKYPFPPDNSEKCHNLWGTG